MKRTGLWLCAIPTMIICVSLLAQEKDRNQLSKSPGDSATSQLTTALLQAKVDFQNGHLSVEARETPLAWLLKKISDKSGVLILAPDIGREKVSLVLSNASLDEVLRQLLRRYDYFAYYGGDPPSLSAVWVYPKGQGRGMEPIPAGQWASTKRVRAPVDGSRPRS